MKKSLPLLLILLIFLLSACSSLSSALTSEEDLAPSWMSRTPQRRGMTSFTASSEGANEDQAFNAASSALLDQLSAYLGLDVSAKYYRELTLFSAISELDLTITSKAYVDGTYYLLAYATTATLDSMRSEEYKAILEREANIKELLDKAMELYKENNDVDAIASLLEAITVSSSGEIFNEEYSEDKILERAISWLKNIRITLSKGVKESGEVVVKVKRNRGLFSPSVSNAPITASFPIRKSDGSLSTYTIPLKTGSDGKAIFKNYYPPMSNSGSIIFSLDLANELKEASVNTGEGFFDEFKSILSKVSTSFTYDIFSLKAQEGIVLVFSEFSSDGEELETEYAKDAFESFLSSEGIYVTTTDGSYDEVAEAVDDIKARYPSMRYLIWARTGITTEEMTSEGRSVRVAGGYTVLVDLISEEILAEDTITQSVTWGEESEDEMMKTLFTRYGAAVAAYIVQFL